MLAAGIAAGAAIGPGPVTSFAAVSRAGTLARVLALLTLRANGAGAGTPPPSATAISPPAPVSRPAAKASATAAGAPRRQRVAHPQRVASPTTGAFSGSSPSSGSNGTGPSGPSRGSEAGSGSQTRSGGEGTPTPLAPIAHAWVISLPPGQSLAGALAEPAAAPYLDGLLRQGTLLSDYTSLAGDQLAGAATLLSAQVDAGVTSISPPGCPSAAGAAGTQAAPCQAGEPAALEADDAFLRQVVPQIEATTTYGEHGLIAITFAGPDTEGSAPAALAPGSSPPTGTSSTPAPAPAPTYPSGTSTSALSASGQAAGVLLLSPFLRHPGARIAKTFNPLSPRRSLEGLLGVHSRVHPRVHPG